MERAPSAAWLEQAQAHRSARCLLAPTAAPACRMRGGALLGSSLAPEELRAAWSELHPPRGLSKLKHTGVRAACSRPRQLRLAGCGAELFSALLSRLKSSAPHGASSIRRPA